MPQGFTTRHRRVPYPRRWHFLFVSVLFGLCPFFVAPFLVAEPIAAPDMALVEPGEAFPGGEATSRKSVKNKRAFSHSSGNLSFKRGLDFKVGNGIFKKLWVSAPASTKSSDGLGPLYNARSCQRCHLRDGRGHPPSANWPEDSAVSMFLRLSIPPQNDAQKARLSADKMLVIPEPTYGSQLQDLSIQGHASEGKMHITYEEIPVKLAGGESVSLRKPTYKITHLGYGALHKDVMLSPRVAPQMIGLGLLEAIRTEDILAKEDPDDKDEDGISGRAARVWSASKNRVVVGRFGWKGGNGTIADQSAAAFKGDIGLSSPLKPGGYGECTEKQSFCRNAPTGDSERFGNVEVSQKMFDLVVFYSQNLAVPKRREHDHPDILKGKALFHTSGCAACHTPTYKTGTLDGALHLSGQKIWPYTDLLLHDMGDGLADHRPEGVASGREWKTPPLWGIGLTPVVNGHSYYLHDGRARSLLEAILWHGGEAKRARDAVTRMSPEERRALIRFVESL